MRTHPVFLRIDGRRCVIIGSDDTAARKARACRAAGAEVTVVAPERYGSEDLTGAVLAALATDPGRGDVMAALLRSPLLELVRDGRRDEIDALLARVAGARCTLDRLGVAP